MRVCVLGTYHRNISYARKYIYTKKFWFFQQASKTVIESSSARLCVCVYSFLCKWIPTVLRRLIGCFIFIGHFPRVSPIISGSFAKNDLQLKASYGSSPPCITFVETWFDLCWVGFRVCRCKYQWDNNRKFILNQPADLAGFSARMRRGKNRTLFSDSKNCMQFVCNRAHCLIKILHEYTLVSKFATVGKSLQKRLRCKIVDFLLQRCGWYLGRKWAIFGCDSFHHSRPRSGGYVKD